MRRLARGNISEETRISLVCFAHITIEQKSLLGKDKAMTNY